jgi:hypothetical protein
LGLFERIELRSFLVLFASATEEQEEKRKEEEEEEENQYGRSGEVS